MALPSSNQTAPPDAARVVVIGGGIIGLSVAYHLTKLGWRDVLLLERKKLTGGTTWHAAGLVRAMLYTANLTKLAQYTIELYRGLEAETGQATGFKQNGSISIATNDERWDELLRGASMARGFGVDADVITAADAKRLWPLLNIDDVLGAIHYPNDGQTNPGDTAMALARGARMGGARIVEDMAVTGIMTANGRVSGVRTAGGDVKAEYVVNCAGLWGREVGRMAGVDVPLQACEHFYVVTEPMAGLSPTLPVMRDMDGCAYYKEDAGKLLLGAFELKAKPWGIDGIPADFSFDELPEDFEHFQPVLETAMRRVPALATVGIRKFFNGPESFTPDVRYLLGEAPGLRNFFVAAGFNSIGIQSAGGAGRALSEWIVGGEPPFDLWDVDIRRTMPFQANKSYLVERVSEALGLLYAMHWPYRQYATARGVRTSPFHDRLVAAGACHGEVAGWERPNWYAPSGVEAAYKYSYKRQNWFAHSAREHRAVREAVGLFDQTSFAKFRVDGLDAEGLLQRLSANDLAVPTGRVVYTQWLNRKGGIEADLTITRLGEEQFMVVTSAASATRDWTWLNRHVAAGERVQITDMTSAEAVLGLMGPASRDLLQRLTDTDLGNAAFPFAHARALDLGAARVRACRITYVGELGWELYIPSEYARGILDLLLGEGKPFGLQLAGYHALDSLRIEKGYRHWGHDIGDEDTPLEAGLGFACRIDKNTGFIGQEALRRQRAEGVGKRLVQFALDDPTPLLYHYEPIWRDGERVGYIASGAYGHSLGRAIGLGYVRRPDGGPVDSTFIESGHYEIEIAWRRHGARASLVPLYDPKSARVRS